MATSYRIYLLVVHTYLTVDLAVRLLKEKSFVKFAQSVQAIVEIITTIPLMTCFILGKDIENFWYRYFMMLDLSRIFNTYRLLNLMEGDVYPGILKIMNNMIGFVCISTGNIQVFET